MPAPLLRCLLIAIRQTFWRSPDARITEAELAGRGRCCARSAADLRMIRLQAHLRDQRHGQRIPGVAEAVCDGEVIVARRRYELRLDPVHPEMGRVFE